MKRGLLALALTLLASGGILLAQEEPPLIENPPAPEATPSPTPVAALPSTPPATATGVLPPALDFKRWQGMTARERQTYVEGAISSTASLTGRLHDEVIGSKGMPREGLASVMRFVNLNSPRRAPLAYLKEMERIYVTAEGQKLMMEECFRRAFERLNTPAAVAPPPQPAPSPGQSPAGQ